MASASVENLKHFCLNGLVLTTDARNIKGSFDAVVTDLPYGRNCPSDESLCREILQNVKQLAPKAAIVVSEDMSCELLKIGYDVREAIKVPKTSLIRYIYVLNSYNLSINRNHLTHRSHL
jgi:tRNA G10  N-methylase Trm11